MLLFAIQLYETFFGYLLQSVSLSHSQLRPSLSLPHKPPPCPPAFTSLSLVLIDRAGDKTRCSLAPHLLQLPWPTGGVQENLRHINLIFVKLNMAYIAHRVCPSYVIRLFYGIFLFRFCIIIQRRKERAKSSFFLFPMHCHSCIS